MAWGAIPKLQYLHHVFYGQVTGILHKYRRGAKWQQERDYELIDRYVDDVMGGCNLKFEDWLNR